MAGKVLNININTHANGIAVRQQTITQSATTQTFYRYQHEENKLYNTINSSVFDRM
jgi:hypothetical protein